MERLREEFVARAQEEKNFSALCREYAISRRTGYIWCARAQRGEPLLERSHRPHHIAGKTSVEIEEAILNLRAQYPAWGGKKIRKVLENQGFEGVPCAKTVGNILKRNGLVTPQGSCKNKPVKRFERKHCNSLWQTDFKGDFGLNGGGRCYPLTILDDHSRFLLKVAVKGNMKNIQEDFRDTFLDYGVPLAILSDNGGTFRGLHGGFVAFERWLMEHDVLPIHGRVRHPQTQGKVERIHGTMDNELLNARTFIDLTQADEAFQSWREVYNTIRPHEALELHCPSEIYEKSTRVYCDKVKEFDYGGDHHVIKVNSWGYVRFAGFQVFLSEAFAEQCLEFRQSAEHDTWIACFRNFRIAEFDAHTGKLMNRSVRRL